jgi:hypothetical protein
MATKLLLAACGLLAAVAASETRAVTELPGITVTGKATPSGDIVSRDRNQRSPDINWPTTLSLKWSEVFAHNEIEISAPCATVWNHLVQAQLWPQWCSFSGKVKIKDGSQILQKNTKFRWSGFDLPQDDIAVFQHSPEPLDSKVIEYVPERRIGWYSFGTLTEHGPLCATYHTWLLTPIGAKKCHVIFEEVATGRAARYARGAYPEIEVASRKRRRFPATESIIILATNRLTLDSAPRCRTRGNVGTWLVVAIGGGMIMEALFS